MPTIHQDRTLSPEAIHSTVPGTAKLVALPPPRQGLHRTPKHPARLLRVGRRLPTPECIAPTAWRPVRGIRVVAGSFLSMSGLIKLPNSKDEPLNGIRLKRPT